MEAGPELYGCSKSGAHIDAQTYIAKPAPWPANLDQTFSEPLAKVSVFGFRQVRNSRTGLADCLVAESMQVFGA
jgi:hypothetical protein